MELNNSSVKANEPAPVMMPLSTTFYSALFIRKKRQRAKGIVNIRHRWTAMYCMYLSSMGSKILCAALHGYVDIIMLTEFISGCVHMCMSACVCLCASFTLVCGCRRPTKWSSSRAPEETRSTWTE